MKNKSNTYMWIGIVVVILALGGWVVYDRTRPGPHDALAECIADSGAMFYGAYWCSNCEDQRNMFGRSERLLPYVECATPGGQGQQRECTDANVDAYPTWVFADGERAVGVQSMAALAERVGCTL